ncbi:gas vesicle protein GvpG [Rhodococcus sp. Z13]|uniref:Gas vesicle protein GvpG n=1 Tax=Rhodococcus sacchari TaxID=2962047 RepID=A0ACD4DG04_9NOCA|nr:gas vesicle protein GvpG [Rhodococcus sp. Z13]UYP18969.1 gas vesicle protein GvpG [Rhodococcus sp. Z13]
MGLVSSLLTLPLAPVKGVLWLGQVIQEQVEQQLHDPATIRRELEEIDEAARAGRITPEEKQAAEQAVLNRMIPGDSPGKAGKE